MIRPRREEDSMNRIRVISSLLLLAGCNSVDGSSTELEGADDVGERAEAARELAPSRGRPWRDNAVTELFGLMGKNAIWTPLESVDMQGWTTFHTEGLVKVGDRFFVSSVETLE